MNDRQDFNLQGQTVRLYFEKAYLKEFEARIVERKTADGDPAVILDQTAFYPEGGGQPCDGGTLNGVDVLRVIEDEGAILHVLKEEIGSGAVHGHIDWPRRFDRMQQHSGQHILSQALFEVLKGETRSFHLGEEASTVEIGLSKIKEEDLDRVETRANAVVFANLEIKTYFVPEEKIGTIPLRRPPKKGGVIRVVEVEGFDYSACGGTHCSRAGEIGLIKITKEEKIRGNLRFEFLCGRRALKDYQEKNRITRHLATAFSVSEKDTPAAVMKSQIELKSLKKRARRVEERIALYEAQEIIRSLQGGIIQSVFEDKSHEEARFLAIQLIRQSECLVLFGAKGDGQSHLILAASESLGVDVRSLIPVVASLAEAKGGGSSSLVELVISDREKLGPALDAARKFIEESLKFKA